MATKANAIFNKRLAELNAFREQFGHTEVPCRYKDNKALGNWVKNVRSSRQAQRYNQKPIIALSMTQISQLDEAQFVWNVKKNETTQQYQVLLNYGQCFTKGTSTQISLQRA